MRRFVPAVFALALACSATLYVRQESDTLYFGTAKPDGSVVSAAEWQQFLDDTVTPRFPGFTQWPADGSWKGKAEATHVLVIVHPAREEAKVRQIVEEYKRRFRQEAVLRVREQVWVPRP